jgi:hypothetical protein
MKIDWKKEISLPKLRRPSLPSRPSMPRLSRSTPKPDQPTPKPSRPSLGGPDLQMPKFLSDLYADLRDRHLLPLVALLIVAIIAAPILLSGKGKEEEPAAITPASVEGEAKDTGLTVVPAEDGLRDYKKRLGHRAALNPFRRPPESNGGEGSSSGSGSGSEGGSESGSGSEPTSSSGSEVSTSTVGGVTTETVGSPSPGPVEQPHHGHHKSSHSESSESESTESTEGAEATSPEPTPTAPAETTEPAKPSEPAHTEAAPHESNESSSTKEATSQGAVVGYTIDAEAGFVPHSTEKTGITPMTKLPNKRHPLILFMGLSQNHKRALFLMTSNVTAYYGGHCALDKQACQLIEVKPGKGVTFAAGYGESRYKLHLNRIVPVRRGAR